MPVNLDAIPQKATKANRPRNLRWLIALVVFMVAGGFLTLWFWRSSRAGSTFWFYFLVLPFSLWLFLFSFRRLIYKGKQVWGSAWDAERENIVEHETLRGQRYARLVYCDTTTALTPKRQSLAKAALANNSVLESSHPRAGEGVIRHSRLAGEKGTEAAAIATIAIRQALSKVVPVISSFPENFTCYVSLQINAGITQEELQALWEQTTSDSQRTTTSFSHYTDISALDAWLDLPPMSASVLVILAAQVTDHPHENSGEAVCCQVFCNREEAQSGVPTLANVHRPEKSVKGRAVNSFDRSLLWANLKPDAIENAWLSGEGMGSDENWLEIIEKFGLALKQGQGSWLLDNVIGYPGKAAPWVTIDAAREKAGMTGEPQLYVWGTGNGISWIGAVTAPKASEAVDAR